jgi:phosphoglucosamine mutase
MRYFGSSGIRGIAYKEFTLDLASRIAFATASRYRDVVLGRDARLTGEAFASAIAASLMSGGAEVCNVGIVTTPTLAYASRSRDCGVMVTASHNPPEYNGIKLWNPDGSSFDTRQMEEIESLMDRELPAADWKSVGTMTEDKNAISEHMSAILSRVGEARLKVVVDCANGPAALITPFVLERMGCRVITLNAHLDGRFPGRPPEPVEENLSSLRNAILSLKADLGIAHDGDADRMVAIDDKGRYAGGDVLLKLFARELGVKSVVAPVDATMLLEDWFGQNVYRTRVGDAYVSEMVKQRGAMFGGEPSGTWVFPEISLCPDGIFAAAKLVEICAKKKLSELIDSLPSFPMLKETLRFDQSKRDTILANLEREIASMGLSGVDRTDGFRLSFEDGWALIRLSGTEPKMRIVVEARTVERAKEILAKMKSIAEVCVR